MRRAGGIRQRVPPQWLRQRGQNAHATHSAQGWLQSLVVPATSQHGATPQLFTPEGGRSAQDTAPVLQSSDRVRKLGGRICDLGLGGRQCIDTGVFQRRHLVHELVFACSPPPRHQISHTILTQADWCAIRAAARCELGLFPVVKTVETGVRV